MASVKGILFALALFYLHLMWSQRIGITLAANKERGVVLTN